MSTVDTNHVAIGTRNHGFLAKLFAMFARWNDARLTRNALSSLSDRELNDIGLTRDDIERVVSAG